MFVCFTWQWNGTKNDRQGEKDGSGVKGGVGWGRLKTGKVYVAKFTKNEMEML